MPPFNAREFAHRWKDVWSGDLESLESIGARQRELIEEAPQQWLKALLRDVPVKALWGFLNDKPKTGGDTTRLEARQMVLRGFQSVPSIVRHPTVQNRLLDWFERHHDAVHVLLLLWAQHETALFSSLPDEPGDDELKSLLRAHGAFALWRAATVRGSKALFERIQQLVENPERLDDLLQSEPSPEPEVAPQEAIDDEADLELWRKRVEQLESELELQARELKQAREQKLELEEMRERLRASTKELERLKKEDRQKTLAASKKLELAQKAAQTELADLKKHDERESRRLNAAVRERDELDGAVKVLRKQVRHLNQLLDGEQKKVASLEARLSERQKTNEAADPKSVDAVSTPETTQEKDKPVKVARPTPLDELFRWVADGHEFRVTPRETMKNIEAGDVDFAFRVQLALDGISPADIAKKNAFLMRLREQDPYYVKVLTEPTQRALVDASNVVRSTKNKRGKGELRNLIGMKKELRRLGFFPIEFIADASLRYNVDDINAYNEMINRGEVEVVTPGTEADEVLVREARSGGGYVVTNDAKFHFKVSPDFAPPSIPFRVFDGTVIIDEF